MPTTNTHNDMEIYNINSIEGNQINCAIETDLPQGNFRQEDKTGKWIVSLSQTKKDIFKVFGIILIPIVTIIIISTAATNGN